MDRFNEYIALLDVGIINFCKEVCKVLIKKGVVSKMQRERERERELKVYFHIDKCE